MGSYTSPFTTKRIKAIEKVDQAITKRIKAIEKVDQAIKQTSREMKYRPHYDNYPLLKIACW